ncbi:MAG: beta propeller repeat protein [Acidimicrobiales bacterium]
MMTASALRACSLLAATLVALTSFIFSTNALASTPSTQTPVLLVRAGSSEVFYVVTTSGCKTPACLRMYRTNSDATKFTRVTAPPVTREQGGTAGTTLDHVVFANANDGYATVGTYSPSALYVTTNGARTWRRVMRAKDLVISVAVTSSEIFVTSVSCHPRSLVCGQYTTRRASLKANDWFTLPRLWKTGTSPKETYYGPSLAAYGSTVWEIQTGPKTYLWTSHNNGRTFSRAQEKFPELVSVSGCTITPMSLISLWAQCPTGMQESFWHSEDGGATWSLASPDKFQFMGTGGGAFDAITSSVAVLDYGAVATPPDLYRISEGGTRFTPIGEVRCSSASPMIFTNISDGLMICGLNSTTLVRRTSNEGATWENVLLPRG